jgi:hypothetical protein
MQLNIHIHAVCPYFEIWKIVPEKKAEKELFNIRNNFQHMLNRSLGRTNAGFTRKQLSVKKLFNEDGFPKLTVKIKVHNPILF